MVMVIRLGPFQVLEPSPPLNGRDLGAVERLGKYNERTQARDLGLISSSEVVKDRMEHGWTILHKS